MTMAVEDLVRYGVAAVGDVSNTLASVAPLASAGISGTVFHEVFGITPRRFVEALEAARATQAALPATPPGLRVVTSPHAIYSTHHPSLVELLRAGPGSLHLAEDPAERAFVSTGTGGFGHLVARMGGRARDLVPKGRSAVAVVAPHLAPHHLVVHVVDLDEDDLALLRASGATAVLCPRSNGYITGSSPPSPRSSPRASRSPSAPTRSPPARPSRRSRTSPSCAARFRRSRRPASSRSPGTAPPSGRRTSAPSRRGSRPASSRRPRA